MRRNIQSVKGAGVPRPHGKFGGGRRAPGHNELNQRPFDVFGRARGSRQEALCNMRGNNGVLGAKLRVPEDPGRGGGGRDLDAAERDPKGFNIAVAAGDEDIGNGGVHLFKEVAKLFNMVLGLALLGRLIRADIKLGLLPKVGDKDPLIYGRATRGGEGHEGFNELRCTKRGTTKVSVKLECKILGKRGAFERVVRGLEVISKMGGEGSKDGVLGDGAGGGNANDAQVGASIPRVVRECSRSEGSSIAHM